MTFEEKLAAYGRKLDEMKAKLDEASDARKQVRKETREEIAADIAKMEAAFDEFDNAVNDQIDKQVDTIDKQIDKQIDTMDERINDAAEVISDSMNRACDKVEQDVNKVKAAFTLDRAAVERLANERTGIDDIQEGTAEQVARAKGDIAVAEENARLIREYRNGKIDASKLRVQMKVNNAKEKIAEHKEAVDKAAQEEWILDLMDYAAACYDMAYAWAMEAEYTQMEAACEIYDYNEKYGTKE